MSAAVESRARPAASALLLGGLVLLALGLRLPSFSGALWGDELATNYVVNGFGVGDLGWILTHGKEATPPLFFVLTWLTRWFDDTEGLRLVSLLAGLAAIPLTYLVGLDTVGRQAATVGATLVALSPFQIFYATEARAYELLMLLCLLATFALLRALRSGRTGWYFRVLTEGIVTAGMPMVLLERPYPAWTVERANRIMHFEKDDRISTAELAAIPLLSASWRTTLARRVEQNIDPDSAKRLVGQNDSR